MHNLHDVADPRQVFGSVELASHTSYPVRRIAWMTSYYYVPGIESMKLTFSAAGKSVSISAATDRSSH